ncbi:SCO family protein [Aestuariicella hydrocarbonica]|uniref:SCO family protein n=1 Tax=Pseudomaricurvus hydrocarbonicus TaxID=1470433 RepID=A0A9E5JTV6_9GAMM|nr:SCO family protein [Aestuariicella hydrocarbonica]NHO66747.1 SCO family protein [Aestuariicella hydrocarbonica]
MKALTLLAISLLIASHAGAQVLAPGYGTLDYQPPEIGTYHLPPLGTAVDGTVRDTAGQSHHLHELFDGRVVLMGFIYTQCPDMNGCPLASYVMKQVQARLLKTPSLRDQVRLISLSFDPQYDTPKIMKTYAHHFRHPEFDWLFLTTDSEADLAPLLQGYDQWRQKVYQDDGSYSGSMSHILRVYLIDRDRNIRNIYNAGFLHVDTVYNDIQTLLQE